MGTSYSITDYFDKALAQLLANKFLEVDKGFKSKEFISEVDKSVQGKSYTKRIIAIAQVLHNYLPSDFKKASVFITSILGEENPNETGMFTEFYWVMPLGKYVELYGLEDLDTSLNTIEEITKRNTGEYAVRPFVRRYPGKTMSRIKIWATSDNFHLRRLASEGLRPKLPWSTKLDVFNENPEPVFEILELLKEDEIMFVKKSVGNHLTDWLKVNQEAVLPLIKKWGESSNKHTQWIVKRATRKFDMDKLEFV